MRNAKELMAAQADAHEEFNEAAALYQNSFRTPFISRRRLRLGVKSAAFKWNRLAAPAALPLVTAIPSDLDRIDHVRMDLIRNNPPKSMEWLLARVGRSGQRYTVSEPESYIDKWTNYRIREIDEALARSGSWRHQGPQCRSVRIEANEALATLRIAMFAAASGDEELLHFVGLLVEP